MTIETVGEEEKRAMAEIVDFPPSPTMRPEQAVGTNLKSIQGSTRWWIAHATTGVVTLITAANWKMVIKAWRN